MDASDHKRPAIDWHHGSTAPRVLSNGTMYKLGTAGTPVTGSTFGGNAACGSTWYTGTDFPAEWRNMYLQSDYGGQWVRAFTMNDQNEITQIRSFCTGENFVFLATHPPEQKPSSMTLIATSSPAPKTSIITG